MRTASVAKVKADLKTYLEQCETEGPLVITRNGKAIAVLLAPHDEDDLERLVLSRSPRFQALLEKSRKSMREGRVLPSKDFWKAVEQRHRKKKASAQNGN